MWCYGNVCSTLFSFESILLKAQLSTGVLFQLFHLLSDVYHVTVRCIRVAFRKARELCVVHNCHKSVTDDFPGATTILWLGTCVHRVY